MIFSKRSIDAIVEGRKTQTRRIWKDFYNLHDNAIYSDHSGRRLYAVGDIVKVQPGRGKPGVWWDPETKAWGIEYADTYPFYRLRIRITAIRHEDARTISAADVAAEGYESYTAWIFEWVGMHDKANMKTMLTESFIGNITPARHRPKEFYDCAALTFEVVI